MTFMELFMNDEVVVEDFADAVAEWHDSNSTQEVYEFLGLSWDEYKQVAVNEENLYQVRRNRMKIV